jgi:signal peptidase I
MSYFKAKDKKSKNTSSDAILDDEPDLLNQDTDSDSIKISESVKKSEDKSRAKMDLYDWMQCFVSAIICGIFIFVFVGRTIGVEGISMFNTLHWNDRVIMSGLFYTPKNGDIVIFRTPSDAFGSTPLVKRVIATEGQTIDINFETGEVFVDGVILDETAYINELTHNRINFVGEVTVPIGHVFVMGDNRNHSADSRDARIGMVDTRYILGKVQFILIPGKDHFSGRNWNRFGSVR